MIPILGDDARQRGASARFALLSVNGAVNAAKTHQRVGKRCLRAWMLCSFDVSGIPCGADFYNIAFFKQFFQSYFNH